MPTKNTLLEAIVVITVIVVVIWLTYPSDQFHELAMAAQARAAVAQAGPDYTPIGDSEIRTVEHDDHKFVLLLTDSGQGISIIHHPGCKCLK